MPSEEMHFRLSAVLLARLDALAAAWGLSRSAAVRRLIELADVDTAPVGIPTMDELMEIAAERARRGNMAGGVVSGGASAG